MFKFDYTTIIVLSYFIFKFNGFNYLLNLNLYFIFFFISMVYSTLFSKVFILSLFKLQLEVKNCIHLLSEIKFESITINKINKKYLTVILCLTKVEAFPLLFLDPILIGLTLYLQIH